jgi:hypothetical protein
MFPTINGGEYSYHKHKKIETVFADVGCSAGGYPENFINIVKIRRIRMIPKIT